MAPNSSSSSHQKLTVRTNRHGAKHVCFAKPSRTGGERATQDTRRVQALGNPMHSNSSSTTMNTAPENPLVTPSSSRRAMHSNSSSTTMKTAPENPLVTPSSSSMSINIGSSASSSRRDVSPSSARMNVDAVRRPRPSSPEGERMRRLRANGLPFLPNSFLRYHQAQKNYEKMKKNKAESAKDK